MLNREIHPRTFNKDSSFIENQTCKLLHLIILQCVAMKWYINTIETLEPKLYNIHKDYSN